MTNVVSVNFDIEISLTTSIKTNLLVIAIANLNPIIIRSGGPGSLRSLFYVKAIWLNHNVHTVTFE